MRRLFCEQARAFFKNHLKVDIEAKNHYLKLNETLNTKNILKSKVVNLLPQDDLALVASHPCFLRFKDDFVGFQHLQDKMSSFKKLRFYLDIPEESTCGKCSMASVCPLKNKAPDAKVTSSKDALWLVYYMACSARYAEMNKEGASTADSVSGDDSIEKLLAEEASKQNEQFSEELGVTEGKHSRPPVKLPPDVPLSPDQEFALYLSGIRLLDQMSVLVCNTVQEREKLDEMLETQILEYTTKKKLDQAFRLETGIQQTLTKKRDKREETKGLHDLVAENKRSMETFSKKFTTSSDFIKETTDEPTQVAPRVQPAPKTELQEVRRSKNTRKST